MKTLLASLLVPAVLSLAVAPAGANLLTNRGFEDGGGSFIGWTTFGALEISDINGDDIYRTGGAAAKVYGNYTGPYNASGFLQNFPVTAGKTYRLSGWSYVSSADSILGIDTCQNNRALAQLTFRSASNGIVARNEVVIGDGNTPLDTWIPFEAELPTPAGAVSVDALILHLQPGFDDGAVFVDDLYFLEFDTPILPNLLANPSFASDLTGWTTFESAFTDDRVGFKRGGLGDKSAKLYTSGLPNTPSGIYQTFAAAPGSAWRMDLHTLTSCEDGDPINLNNTNQVVAVIEFRDSGGLPLGTASQVVLDNTSPLGKWEAHTLVATDAPAGTDSVACFVLFESPDLFPGAAWIDDVSFSELASTATPDGRVDAGLTLRQNAPNPFRSSTRIAFSLEQASDVSLRVFDVTGRQVATLASGALPAGNHEVGWDGRSDAGVRLAAGNYWYVLRTDRGRVAKGLLLLD